MPSLVAPPPTQITQQISISVEKALATLQSYLAASVTDASLHPDAYLTTDGPTFSQSGPQGGVIMTQLRRLEAGMRGERIISAAEGETDLDGTDAEAGGDGAALGGLGPQGFNDEENTVERRTEYTDAVDADTYAREQEEDESEADSDGIGGGGGQKIPGTDGMATERDTAGNTSASGKKKGGAGGERVGGDASGDVTVDTETVKLPPVDKEARKKDKKARKKEEQKERAEKRRKV